MGQDDRGGIVVERPFDDFSRMDAGTIDGAEKQLFELYDAMASIEKQTGKHLVWVVAQFGAEKAARFSRVGERVVTAQTFIEMSAAHFKRGLKLCILGRSQTFAVTELALSSIKQGTQAAVLIEQIPGEINGCFAGDAGAKKYC